MVWESKEGGTTDSLFGKFDFLFLGDDQSRDGLPFVDQDLLKGRLEQQITKQISLSHMYFYKRWK